MTRPANSGSSASAILMMVLLVAVMVISHPASAQQQPGSLSREQDHQRSLELLGIAALRPGANGSDPGASNAANYDESLANPYPVLPDPLFSKGRQRITTAEAWWNIRRPELVELFDREIYGRMPADLPVVSWTAGTPRRFRAGDIDAVEIELNGRVDNSPYPALAPVLHAWLVLPADAAAPVPVVMQLIGGRFVDLYRERAPEAGSWQSQILQRGWAYMHLDTESIQTDNGGGLTSGIIGLANKGQPRAMDDWGVLRAWSWGASRLLDFVESDARLDATRVAIEGHSRWGKAALVAMAYEPRFSAAYISSSGAGGAKLHRRNWGELVENVAAPSEYHWMAGNYLKYAGPMGWDDLPVDAHELIALCAPRPVFISSGFEGDEWVDARGMFMAAVAAQPVYRLLGARDMGTSEFPALGAGLMAGEIAFRQHAGGHTDGPNWPVFLQFAARYWE